MALRLYLYIIIEEIKMDIMNEWWGYQHSNGSFQVKRYFDERDISDAHDSPFCARVFNKFMARDRDHALTIVKGETQ